MYRSPINDFPLSKIFERDNSRDAYSFVLNRYETNTRRLKVSFCQNTEMLFAAEIPFRCPVS